MELIQLIINGTTKFSSMIAELVEMEGLAKVVAYTTKKSLIDKPTLGGKEVVPFEELNDRFDKKAVRILNTIGYSKMNTIRERVNDEIASVEIQPFSYISTRAFIAKSTDDLLTSGCIIMPNVFIGSNVQIGESTVIYSNCSLTHDIVIGNNSFLGSGCVIGGNVTIGKNSFIGMNSTIKNRVSLGAFTLVGCGSNVINTYADERCVIVGNPAKVLMGKDSLNTI